MPNLGGYCRGLIRYRIECQPSEHTTIILSYYYAKNRYADYGDALVWHCYVAFHEGGCKLPAQSTASSICKIRLAPYWSWELSSKPSHHHRDASSASSRRARRALWRWVFIVAGLAASRVLPVPIVNDFEVGAPVVDEDADAAQDTCCQCKAADPAPPADPWNVQGALPLNSGHEEEDRITSLLLRHIPLSNIAGYNLAQGKIIYVCDVQKRERLSKLKKSGRNCWTAIEIWRCCPHAARQQQNVDFFNSLVGWWFNVSGAGMNSLRYYCSDHHTKPWILQWIQVH